MDLKNLISITEGFPKAGISFKDMSPLLADPVAFQQAIAGLTALAKDLAPEVVLGAESRGFVIGAPLALSLGVGFVMARKPGKLPGELLSETYGLEYGSDSLYVEKNLIKPGTRVLIADDLMATGGTASALVRLVQKCGAIPVGVVALIELTGFKGDEEFAPVPFRSLISFKK